MGCIHESRCSVINTIRNGADLFVKPEETVEVLKIREACVISNRYKKTIVL